jgi:exopolysaccharide biosynthesis WecB/TagA/CpsF family protein
MSENTSITSSNCTSLLGGTKLLRSSETVTIPTPKQNNARGTSMDVGSTLSNPDADPETEHVRVTYKLDNYGLSDFLSVASNFNANEYGFVATPNVDGLIRLKESASFRAAYAKAAYVLLDSRVASFLFRLFRNVRIPVCPGSDLTDALFTRVIRPDDHIVLVGSTEPQAQMLRERFGLKHLIHYNPPMGFIRDPEAVEATLQFVESASPFRFCLVAVGDPQGVYLAHRLGERQKARGLAFIIGASIDFMTGKQRRAPTWMQRIGFEWFFRLLSDPRRLARRYLVRGPKFFAYLGTTRVLLRQAE